MRPFKFFQKFIPYQLEISFPHRRYLRFPTRQVPSIEGYNTPELRSIFLQGWRACEQGNQIYNNPHSRYNQIIYDAWEVGYLECYHNHPSRDIEPSDNQCYQNGWERAQLGYPLNQNPHLYGSNQFNLWFCGWNDYTDSH